MNDFKMKYQIVADAAKAKAEVKSFDDLLKHSGASIGSAFAGPAATAAVGVAAIGTAAIGAGVALFELTKTAAEYGSTIFDASKKTGLHAESLSAMDFAAKQSGTSLEAITGGVAKFAKTVGEAADGSDKAAAKLKDFGITPQQAINDLDGALGAVFKRIIDAPPGIERMTLAQKAFGKSGAELLPFIDSFDGDLGKLIKKAKDLGVTIDDEAARAADEFGDQLDTLSEQLAGAGRAIAGPFMEPFTDMAKGVSGWLTQNKDEVARWGQQMADTLTGLISYWNDYHRAATGGSVYTKNAAGDKMFAGDFLLSGALGVALSNRGSQSRMDHAGAAWQGNQFYLDPRTMTIGPRPPSSTVPSSLGGGGGGGGKHRPPRETDSEFRKFFTERGFGVNRTFGGAINSGSLHPSGLAADVSIKGKSVAEIFALTAAALEKGYRLFDERVKRPGVKQTGPHLHYERGGSLKDSSFLDASYYGGADQLAYLKKLDAERLGKAKGTTGLDAFRKDQVDDQKKLNEQTLDVIREGIDQEIELYEARGETKLALLESDVAAGLKTEEQAADERMKIEEDVINFKIKKLQEYADIEEVDARDRGRIAQQVALLTEDLEQKRAQREQQRHAAEQKRLAEKRKSWNEYVEAIKAATEAQDEADAKRGRANYEAGTVLGGTGIGGAIAHGLGTDLVPMFDDATNAMLTFQQRLALVHADINSFVGDAIGGMIQGLTQMAVAWILTGEGSAQAALQMAAGVALSIAIQATIKGFFEMAEAAADAAVGNIQGAIAHGNAAALYFSTAITAGAIGGGLAVGARLAGGGGGKGGSGGRGSSSSASSNGNGSREREVRPYSRQSDDVYISGHRPDDPLARAVEKLNKKLDSMNPGDVLVRGANQRKGFIGTQTVNDMKSMPQLGSTLMRRMGGR
jgi:hypothetical protein